MIVAHGSLADRLIKRPVILFAAVLLLLGGCDSCVPRQTSRIELYRPDEPGALRAQSPVSPVGTPVQTPDTPQAAQSPESPDGRPVPEVPSPVDLALAKVRELKAGTPYSEVHKVLDGPGVLIAGTDDANSVYRWHLAGINFMGRFEKGVLTRSNIAFHDGKVAAAGHEDAVFFNQDLYDLITPGMTFGEVKALMGVEHQKLTSGASEVAIYKWSDSRGSSIIGRFVDGVLERKSGSIRGPEAEEEPRESPPRQAPVLPQVPDRIRVAPQMPSAMEDEGEAYDPEYDEAVDENGQSSRVHVVGASRREREQEEDPALQSGRSYKPLARFPDYGRRLRRGDFEIRVRNRSSVSMDVAVVSNEGGRETTITSGGTASVFVGRGTYEMYYIYNDDQMTLYQTQHLPVNDTLADYVVDIYDDSYDVNYLDRNVEPPSSSRR